MQAPGRPGKPPRTELRKYRAGLDVHGESVGGRSESGDAAWSAADKWTLTVAILAVAVSAIALVVAQRQLRIQRQDSVGGKSIEWGAGPLHAPDITEGEEFEPCRVIVRVIGPRVLYEVRVRLEMDGRPYTTGGLFPVPMATLDQSDGRWEFRFSVRKADLPRVWCLLEWAEPNGITVRTEVMATRLSTRDDYYEWRWWPGSKYWWRAQDVASRHGPAWFRSVAGRPRRLGRWRRSIGGSRRPGQGPFSLGKPPGPFDLEGGELAAALDRDA